MTTDRAEMPCTHIVVTWLKSLGHGGRPASRERLVLPLSNAAIGPSVRLSLIPCPYSSYNNGAF